MELTERAWALEKELAALREQLHCCPERGNREFETARLIEKGLQSCGIRTVRLTETGVMGVLVGAHPGKTVCLRADMDALPIREETSAAFASQNEGVMHACGHDIHVTAALGAARLLSERKDRLYGTVRFLFQPDEEEDGGAERMIAAGCMDGADAVLGAHVCPDLPLGTVGIRYGKFYAAADKPDIMIQGKSCHGATPENGIDALYAAALLAARLKELPERFPGDSFVCTVGQMSAGTARNIVAGQAELNCILRTLGPDTRKRIQKAIHDAAAEIESKTGAHITVRITEGYPGIVNEDSVTMLAEKTAQRVFGTEKTIRIDTPTMTTEDFGYYQMKAPGCFYHLGVGGNEPLHSACFLPDSKAAVYGALMHASVIEAFLTKD